MLKKNINHVEIKYIFKEFFEGSNSSVILPFLFAQKREPIERMKDMKNQYY